MSKPTVPTPIITSALAQLQADLAAMPAEASMVLVTAIDDKGFTTGFARRVGDGWSISAKVVQRWRRQRPDAKVVLAKTWK